MEYNKEMTELYSDSDDNSVDSNGNPSSERRRTSSSSRKRINKPLMERKRRARINQSLAQLKSLVLAGMKKDPSRHNRLEKADILEMTVNHIQQIHRLPLPKADAATLEDKYRVGYTECAGEVSRYLDKANDLDDRIKVNILTHLQGRVHTMIQESPPMPSPTPPNLNHNTLLTTPLRKLLPKTEITPVSTTTLCKPVILDLRTDPSNKTAASPCTRLLIDTNIIEDLSNNNCTRVLAPMTSGLLVVQNNEVQNCSSDTTPHEQVDDQCTSASDVESVDSQIEENNAEEKDSRENSDDNHEHYRHGDMWRPW